MTQERLDCYSEPFGSTGNIGDNFIRLLGAPTLDTVQTLVRESVQNIADAAKLGDGPEILIRLRRLTPDQAETLWNVALGDLPESHDTIGKFAAARRRDAVVVLEICDFRTTGLGGPTRSDRIPVGTEDTDFIDFLRNIGVPRNTDHGGGTYGFGKVALYRASACRTILVDTHPVGTDESGRRLIGCHIGSSFEVAEGGMARRYTGRHWWGTADPQDGIVDPLTGPEAARLASLVGFPDRGPNRTGTSIMIIDALADDEASESGEHDLRDTGHRIIESLLWYFWPRMMQSSDPRKRFDCRVEVDGEVLEIPAPESCPPLDLFCKAMVAVRNEQGNDVRPISCGRPITHLGTLAIERGLRVPPNRLVADPAGSLFPVRAHHIALMRPVELVVKYLEGQPAPHEGASWAGVFRVSDDQRVEQAFADSEPPAHDDWAPESLPKGNEKTYVNVAIKQLRKIASEMGNAQTNPARSNASGPSLARIADRLGAALKNVGGDAAGRRKSSGTRSTSRPRVARVSKPDFRNLELVDGERVAVFTVVVTQDKVRSGVSLDVEAAVSVDGGTARQLDGFAEPEVIGITNASGAHQPGTRFELDGQEGTFEIRVRMPDEYAVTLVASVATESSP